MTDLKFTSPSGETTLKFEDTGRIGTVSPKTQLHIKMDEPVKYEKPMTAIEDIEAQIKVLQSKLEFYKELENHKTPCEEAYKRVYGHYPNTKRDDYGRPYDERWFPFSSGYEVSQKDYKVGEYQEEPEDNEWRSVALRFGERLVSINPCGYYDFTPTEWIEWALNAYEKTADDYLKLLEKERTKAQKRGERLHKDVERVVKENMKWFEENPDKDPLDWVKPQTPKKPAKDKVSLYKRFEEESAYGRLYYDDALKVVKEFFIDEAVIENQDHEYITFTLQKSLLEVPNA